MGTKPGPEGKGLFGFGGGEEKKLLKELKAEVVQLRSAVGDLSVTVSQLAKIVGEGKPINIQFSWPMDNELMQIVKDIQARIGTVPSGGASKEEIEQILGPVVERMKAVGVPTPAIEPQP